MISAICMLMCISGAVVYTTWLSGDEETVYAESLAQIEEEMALASIAMNDDAQVINGGSQDMWVRAKVEFPKGGQATETGKENYRLVSDTIVEDPSEKERKSGIWTYEEDGFFYYSLTVSPGEQSKALFLSVVGTGDDGVLSGSSVKVQAEGVQTNWISKKARSGKEAFRLFQMFQPLQEYKGKFV